MGNRGSTLVIDLVERHPVLYLIVVSFKAGLCKSDKEINAASVHEAVVLFGKMPWHLKVLQGNDRLNVIFMALIKQIIIELQALFIRLRIITIRVDAAPGNGCAE